MVTCFLRGMPQGFPRASAIDKQEIENDLCRNKLLTSYGDEKRLNYRGKISWKKESVSGLGNPSKVSVWAGLSCEESLDSLNFLGWQLLGVKSIIMKISTQTKCLGKVGDSFTCDYLETLNSWVLFLTLSWISKTNLVNLFLLSLF